MSDHKGKPPRFDVAKERAEIDKLKKDPESKLDVKDLMDAAALVGYKTAKQEMIGWLVEQYNTHKTDDVIPARQFLKALILVLEKSGEGLVQLFDYQVKAVLQLKDALLQSEPMLLADLPGLGKTAQMLMATKAAGITKFAVVCPAIAASVWRHEAVKWLGRYDPATMPIFTYPDFSLNKRNAEFEVFINGATTAVLIDECHYLKDLSSNRTKVVYTAIQNSRNRRIIVASGTPAPNHYGELYPLFRNLWPKLIATDYKVWSKEKFEDTFCTKRAMRLKNGRTIETVVGSKNGPLLKAMLAGVMIRRKPEDVIKDMPPLIFDTLPLSVPSAIIPDMQEAEAFDDDELLDLMSRAPATVRRETGLAKVAPLIEYLMNELDPDPKRKIGVFAVHHDVIDALFQGLAQYKPVKVDGRDSQANRDIAIGRFQTGDSQVFVGQIQAAGVAITLTAAHEVIFAESSYVPGDNFQAAKRFHRIGSTQAVIARHAVAEGTWDEKVMDIVVRKENDLAQVF